MTHKCTQQVAPKWAKQEGKTTDVEETEGNGDSSSEGPSANQDPGYQGFGL